MPGAASDGDYPRAWPRRVARSYPHRVALLLVNRDTEDCHAEAVGVITVSTAK